MGTPTVEPDEFDERAEPDLAASSDLPSETGDDGVAGRRRPAGVPEWLDRAAALSWRLLVVAAAIFVAAAALSRILVVVVPVVVALFLSTILTPPARWLRRRGWPPALATWAVFVASALLLGGIVAWLVPTIAHEVGAIGDSASRGIKQVQDWLVHGRLHLSRRDVRRDFNQVGDQLKANAGGFALRGAAIVGQLVTGILLSLVLTFFFVKDGDRLANGMLRLASSTRHHDLRALGRRGWSTLTGYIRGTAINGVINGALMTAGLLIIGVPLAAPIGVLTFFGAFFPIVGAIVTGLLAALVALVAKGPVAALIVVGLTVLIHNVEGYLVGPLVLGRAVKLHPVAILLALAIGGLLAGIVGAFLAVPTTAVAASVYDFYHPPEEPNAESEPPGSPLPR
jgi:putative heme transporter